MRVVQHCEKISSLIPFFLLIGTFTWLTRPGPYKAMACRERELAVDHIHTFLTTQRHRGLLEVSVQLNAGATSETTRTLKTIHIIHSNKADMRRLIRRPSDIRGPGDLVGLKLPDMCLTDEEKTSIRKLVLTGEGTRTRTLPPASQRWTISSILASKNIFLNTFTTIQYNR